MQFVFPYSRRDHARLRDLQIADAIRMLGTAADEVVLGKDPHQLFSVMDDEGADVDINELADGLFDGSVLRDAVDAAVPRLQVLDALHLRSFRARSGIAIAALSGRWV
jgi:hypothetical protein